MLPALCNAIKIAQKVHAVAVSMDLHDDTLQARYNEMCAAICRDENVGCYVYLLTNVPHLAIGVDGAEPASAVSYKIAMEEASKLILANACRL